MPGFGGGFGPRRADLPDAFDDNPDFDRDRDLNDVRLDSVVLLPLSLRFESIVAVDGDRSNFSSCPVRCFFFIGIVSAGLIP